jgi:hypothetical protein
MTKQLKTDREKMQALLDGHTVKAFDGTLFRMSATGMIQFLDEINSEWAESCGTSLFEEGEGPATIYKEPPKPCGFIEAVKRTKAGTTFYSKSAESILSVGSMHVVGSLHYRAILEAQDWLPIEEASMSGDIYDNDEMFKIKCADTPQGATGVLLPDNGKEFHVLNKGESMRIYPPAPSETATNPRREFWCAAFCAGATGYIARYLPSSVVMSSSNEFADAALVEFEKRWGSK